MDNRKIGAFIQQLRKDKGLTQQALADAINVSDKAVSKWERGDGLPETTMFPVLAEYFGVTIDELFHGEHAPKPAPLIYNPTSVQTVIPKETYSAEQIRIAKILFGIVLMLLLTSIPMQLSVVPVLSGITTAIVISAVILLLVWHKASDESVPVLLNVIDIVGIIYWLGIHFTCGYTMLLQAVSVARLTYLLLSAFGMMTVLIGIATVIYLCVKRHRIHWIVSVLVIAALIMQRVSLYVLSSVI